MRVIKIDENCLFVEDLPHYDGEITEDIIETMCPEGFRLPKWTGTEWVEGLTQAEIDAKNNVPRTLTEEQQRLLDLETAMTQILGGGV